MRKIYFCFGVLIVLCFLSISSVANAGIFDVVNAVNSVSGAVHSVNRTTRDTMSTVEFGQRFNDRRQERRDRKSVEANYNNDTEAEYYKTLQETQKLQQKSNFNNDL